MVGASGFLAELGLASQRARPVASCSLVVTAGCGGCVVSSGYAGLQGSTNPDLHHLNLSGGGQPLLRRRCEVASLRFKLVV